MKQNNKLNNIVLHVKYPYVAVIIAIMWIGMSIIIINQENPKYDILVVATAFSTIFIAVLGFRNNNK